jgi:hypothetical protein
MKAIKSNRWMTWLMVMLILLTNSSAFACTACFGDPNSNTTKGVVAAIWLLLLVVGGILTAIAGFFIYLVRRSSTNPVMPSQQSAALPTMNSKS